MDYMLETPKDGHTIALITQTHLLTILRSKGKYKYEDLVPLARATEDPQILMVGKNSPFKTAQDFVAAGKGKALKYGTTHVGSVDHIALGGRRARRQAPARRSSCRSAAAATSSSTWSAATSTARWSTTPRPSRRSSRATSAPLAIFADKPAEGAAQRADRQGDRRRRRQPVHGARLRHLARHAAGPRQGARGGPGQGDAGPDVHHLPGELRARRWTAWPAPGPWKAQLDQFMVEGKQTLEALGLLK